MLAKVCSAAVSEIEAYPAEVEVNAGYGDTIIVIVGLLDAAVKESRDRTVAAPINLGLSALGRKFGDVFHGSGRQGTGGLVFDSCDQLLEFKACEFPFERLGDLLVV